VTGEYDCPTRNCTAPPPPSPAPGRHDWLTWAGVIALVHSGVALILLAVGTSYALRRGTLRG